MSAGVGERLRPGGDSVAFYSTIGVQVEPRDYCGHLSAPPNVLVTMSGARAPIPVGVVLLGLRYKISLGKTLRRAAAAGGGGVTCIGWQEGYAGWLKS